MLRVSTLFQILSSTFFWLFCSEKYSLSLVHSGFYVVFNSFLPTFPFQAIMKQERDKFAKARLQSKRRKSGGKSDPVDAMDKRAGAGRFGRAGGAEEGAGQWIKSALGMKTYWQRRKERRMTKRKLRKKEEEGDDMDKDVSTNSLQTLRFPKTKGCLIFDWYDYTARIKIDIKIKQMTELDMNASSWLYSGLANTVGKNQPISIRMGFTSEGLFVIKVQ